MIPASLLALGLAVTASASEPTRAPEARQSAASPAPAARLSQPSDEELLYREALRLGLDRALDHPVDPGSARKILVEQMRLLLSRPERRERVSETELRRYYRGHMERFRTPPRISLSQVFLSPPRDSARARAGKILPKLGSGSGAGKDLAALSDPFPMELELRLVSEEYLSRRFGPGFAASLRGLPPHRWSGPIESPLGLHLIRIDGKVPSSIAPFAVVRKTIAAAISKERAERRLAGALRRMAAGGGKTAINPD